MDTTKHTVTIPISDYNELLNKSNDIDISRKHFELLYAEGIEIVGGLNLTKNPK